MNSFKRIGTKDACCDEDVNVLIRQCIRECLKHHQSFWVGGHNDTTVFAHRQASGISVHVCNSSGTYVLETVDGSFVPYKHPCNKGS